MEKWKTLTLFGDYRCRWVLNDLLSRDCWKYWHFLQVQVQQFCVFCDGMYTEAPHLIRFTKFQVIFTTTMMRSCVLQAESEHETAARYKDRNTKRNHGDLIVLNFLLLRYLQYKSRYKSNIHVDCLLFVVFFVLKTPSNGKVNEHHIAVVVAGFHSTLLCLKHFLPLMRLCLCVRLPTSRWTRTRNHRTLL